MIITRSLSDSILDFAFSRCFIMLLNKFLVLLTYYSAIGLAKGGSSFALGSLPEFFD